jgi:hypothetical protein
VPAAVPAAEPPTEPAAEPAPEPATAAGRQAHLRAHRRERLADAARMLPLAGAVLVLAPDLFLSGRPAAEGATAPWAVYLFVAWGGLIACAAVLSSRLARRRPGAWPGRG